VKEKKERKEGRKERKKRGREEVLVFSPLSASQGWELCMQGKAVRQGGLLPILPFQLTQEKQ
jgi:hypothetical protein